MAKYRKVRVAAHTRLVAIGVKGSSWSKDKKRHAKKPGKRRSRKGKVYYESRRNRADINKWL